MNWRLLPDGYFSAVNGSHTENDYDIPLSKWDLNGQQKWTFIAFSSFTRKPVLFK